MEAFVVSFLSGISLGMIYFLIAAGLSMVMGLMGIINLAHGALFMLGAYLGVTVAKSTGSFMLGILAGIASAGVAGLVMERGFFSRLYRREFEQILVTFGFIYIITNVHLWIYGIYPKSPFIPSILAGTINIGGFLFPIYRFAVIIIGLAIFFGLWWLQEKTRIGAIIQAGMDDKEMTSGLGINLTPINIGAFFVGSCLAGFAGVIGTSQLGAVDLQSGLNMLFVALIVVIVGGVGSIQGALFGALLIGVATALAATYVPVISMFVMYVAVILVLLFRPSGLIGRRF
jgi:branched-chain amino acid transport system permease protein